MTTYNGPDKDCFHTFKYRSGYISTCQNRITHQEEVKYQIERHIAKAKSVRAAKIAITQYMKENPYIFKLETYNTIYTLVVPRSRSLTLDEADILNHIMSVFTFLLEVPPTQKKYTIDPDELANKILSTYCTNTPLPHYDNIIHNIIQNTIVDALKNDPGFFDGLDCFEMLDDLAQEKNVSVDVVKSIYDRVRIQPSDYIGSRVQVSVDLLRSL